MAHSGLNEKINTGLWTKWAANATKLESIMANMHKEKCAHKNFCGNIPDYAISSKTLEEMGVLQSIVSI